MIIGVDFGAPREARKQRRKIIAIAAQAAGRRAYRIDATGLNQRLLASDPPGWSARALLEELLARPARVIGFDFPFSVPRALLREPRFAADAGYPDGAFTDWRSFSQWISRRLPLTDPIDFAPFARWRASSTAARARLWMKRATDEDAGGQPPLKDLFQATFQMTLLGNALLAKLWESHRYRVQPFRDGSGDGEVIEVYPGATLRAMKLPQYKSHPDEAVRLAIEACAIAGITIDVDPRLRDVATSYSSGSAKAPDHDVADAFVALCTAILYAEGACRPALAPEVLAHDPPVTESEGAIWVPKEGGL